MTKNRPKNGSLNRDLLNFLYMFGIFWMPPGESSHPGGSEYVWQRGVEGTSGRLSPVRYVLKIHFFIEFGLNMIR